MGQPRNFKTAQERKDAIKSSFKPLSNAKVYARKDVRVGDTIKVIGRVEEWMRKKAGGGLEWIRGVGVDEGQGGSIGMFNNEQITPG